MPEIAAREAFRMPETAGRPPLPAATKARTPKAAINPVTGLYRGARGADPLHFFISHGVHADVVEFPSPFGKFFLVNEPGYIEHVLEGNWRNYPKSDFYKRVRTLFGEGLFELEGEEWKRKRLTMQPAFHRQAIDRLGAVIVEQVDLSLRAWQDKGGVALDITRPLMQMTINVISKALCAETVPGDMNQITDALTIIMREGESLLWSLAPGLHALPSPHRTKIRKALQTFDQAIYDLIRHRLADAAGHEDLLALLLAQKDNATGEPVSWQVLRDDLTTMIIAGHETTATAIAWTCALLSKHPEVMRRAAAEVDALLGGRPPTIQDLPRLQYVNRVVQEALRLYPPFWTISRRAEQPDRLGPHEIPAGATLMLCPYVTHRNPRYWRNPEGFDPERFTEAESVGRPKYAYFPFGGGPRICLGRSLAMMEAEIYLAMLLQRYTFELSPLSRMDAEPMISLRPRYGLPMVIRQRGVAAMANAAE